MDRGDSRARDWIRLVFDFLLFWVKFPKILIKSILEQVGKQTCCPPWIHKVPNDVSGVASAGALPPKASLEKHLVNLQPFCIIVNHGCKPANCVYKFRIYIDISNCILYFFFFSKYLEALRADDMAVRTSMVTDRPLYTASNAGPLITHNARVRVKKQTRPTANTPWVNSRICNSSRHK